MDWCAWNYLNYAKLRSAQATFDSIVRWSQRELNFRPMAAPANIRGTPRYVSVITKALLSAGFVQIAVRDPQDQLRTTYRTLEENQPSLIHPSSTVSRGYKHDFVFYDKFVDQARPYFMDVTGFDPEWLFEQDHLSSYVDRLLDGERLPRSENFCSLKRLEAARSAHRKRVSSDRT